MTLCLALKEVATKIAARLTTISWSEETEIPKGPVAVKKNMIKSVPRINLMLQV